MPACLMILHWFLPGWTLCCSRWLAPVLYLAPRGFSKWETKTGDQRLGELWVTIPSAPLCHASLTGSAILHLEPQRLEDHGYCSIVSWGLLSPPWLLFLWRSGDSSLLFWLWGANSFPCSQVLGTSASLSDSLHHAHNFVSGSIIELFPSPNRVSYLFPAETLNDADHNHNDVISMMLSTRSLFSFLKINFLSMHQFASCFQLQKSYHSIKIVWAIYVKHLT